MTVKPDKSYFIEYPPKTDDVDLVERVQKGVAMAKADGFDTCFILESDDYYPPDYFKNFNRRDFTFWGAERTTYYNLRSRTYTYFHHPGRSSLFITGFKISALNGFAWTAPKGRFLDISLWDYAERSLLPRQILPVTQAVGMKHNLGLCAGKGHTMRGANEDNNLQWLKNNVDREAFDFYSALMKKL